MIGYEGAQQPVQTGPATGLVTQLGLLGALAATVGLGGTGWAVGTACGVVVDAALTRGLLRDRAARLGPAGWITLTRATLAVGVAALVADSFVRHVPVAAIAALAAVALVLDFADGRVARSTGTVSSLGARFDGEVDAFLIAALSVDVARSAGAWVLAIGAMRYLFAVAGLPLSSMRASLPRRDWRKVVAATQGIVLTAAAAQVLPPAATRAALAVALAMLGESFGRDVVWLWRRRDGAAGATGTVGPSDDQATPVPGPPEAPRRGRLRTGMAVVLTSLALLLVWVVLVAPDRPSRLSLDAFVRLPLEGLLVVALAVLLPARARHVLAWVVGPLLGVLLLVKVLDLSFFTAFDRPFNPVGDWSYASIGSETLRDSIGRTSADVVLVVLALLVVAVLVLPALAVRRVTRIAAGHPRFALRTLAVLGCAWALCFAFGARLVSSAPIASVSAADLAVHEVRAVQAGFRDRAAFARSLTADRYRYTPGSDLLTALRGKDVLLVFVESYGKGAVQGTSFSPGVDRVLDSGTRQLQAAGFASQSGWLTSPTFGGISWLAHSTLQSGVWVDSPGRYDELISSDRFTLSQAFRRAGWRAIDDVPSNDRPWPEGSAYYHYDAVYNRLQVGYRGPKYAYASMPDQYVLSALQRLELAKARRRPLFAEVDLVSSHTPWTRIPPLIPWNQVGDGSIFKRLPVDTSSWTSPARVRAAYGRSVQYSLRALFSYVQRFGSKNLVTVVLGDHQPSTIVSGQDASHDVPIAVVAHDPTVMQRIGSWGWTHGMRPAATAPVWPMSAFRDRFLAAFGSKATS